MKLIFMYFIPTAVSSSEAQLSLPAPLLELLQSSHGIRDQCPYTHKTPDKTLFVYSLGFYSYIYSREDKRF